MNEPEGVTEAEFRHRTGLGPKPQAPDGAIDWSDCPLARRFPYGIYPGLTKNESNVDLL